MLMGKNKIIIISVAILAISVSAYFGFLNTSSSSLNSIKAKAEPVDVTVEEVYKSQGNVISYNYSGIIISTKRIGNFTAFQLADSFSVLTPVDSSGTSLQINTFNDPKEEIKVSKTIRIGVVETSSICSVNLIFENGTKIINADNSFDIIKYNKTITGDKRCISNNITRYGISWQVS